MRTQRSLIASALILSLAKCVWAIKSPERFNRSQWSFSGYGSSVLPCDDNRNLWISELSCQMCNPDSRHDQFGIQRRANQIQRAICSARNSRKTTQSKDSGNFDYKSWNLRNKRMDFHAQSRCEESGQTQTGKNSPTVDRRAKQQFNSRVSPIELLGLGNKWQALHITLDSLYPSNLIWLWSSKEFSLL